MKLLLQNFQYNFNKLSIIIMILFLWLLKRSLKFVTYKARFLRETERLPLSTVMTDIHLC